VWWGVFFTLTSLHATPIPLTHLLHTAHRTLHRTSHTQAMAATGRLRSVFGDSWAAKKERILGARWEHDEDGDEGDDGGEVIVCDPVGRRSPQPPLLGMGAGVAPARAASPAVDGMLRGDVAAAAGTRVARGVSPTLGAADNHPPSGAHSNGMSNGGAAAVGGGPRAAYWPAWDLRAFIVKSNDDLRQVVTHPPTLTHSPEGIVASPSCASQLQSIPVDFACTDTRIVPRYLLPGPRCFAAVRCGRRCVACN